MSGEKRETCPECGNLHIAGRLFEKFDCPRCCSKKSPKEIMNFMEDNDTEDMERYYSLLTEEEKHDFELQLDTYKQIRGNITTSSEINITLNARRPNCYDDKGSCSYFDSLTYPMCNIFRHDLDVIEICGLKIYKPCQECLDHEKLEED